MKMNKIHIKYFYWTLTILIFVSFAEMPNGLAAPEAQYESTHLSKEELTEVLKSGDLLSLEKIIKKIKRESHDRMLEVELLNYDGVLIYQIEILKTSGVVITHYLDGKTGNDASHLLED
ncbi:MAG: hypothetical protein JKY84_02540 [Emcibacteraceae bacterium]|nr:hypothetical protein [Emcibacteraceae bacterium]